jgi:hypothetical protein
MVSAGIQPRLASQYCPPMPAAKRWIWIVAMEHDGAWVVSRLGDSRCVVRPTCSFEMDPCSRTCRERCEQIMVALNRIYSGQISDL